MSTPNMGLTLPTDHGSADVWDTILDAAFGLLDSHDHTTGRGAKVPSAALKIDNDVSWSSAGSSHAITDLNALDFRAAASTSVSSLAGALFLSDGTGSLTVNELYWRTTGGVNVKLTNGAALNVAAFAGGIGGDYSAAGASVIFDDATDSYWFQQQVGAAVRQYARMRSADVDLYEFKAHPTAGVPTNRVRLASPAALAASYALTFPGALPAAKSIVQVDSAGLITIGGTRTRLFSVLLGVITAPAAVVNVAAGAVVDLSNSTGTQFFPVQLEVGETITSWSTALDKTSAAGTISARLFDQNCAALSSSVVGVVQSNGAASPGAIALGQSGLSTPAASGHAYYIQINGGGTIGDRVIGYSVTVSF